MTKVEHRSVETNGIRMHIAGQGAGPLIVLCHGFPESWYWYRNVDRNWEVQALVRGLIVATGDIAVNQARGELTKS